jgi:hypothetical protein
MKKIIYLTTCLPDYFQGFGGETLIALHWRGQTVAQAIEDLERNASNECHDPEVYAAIEDFKNKFKSDSIMISETHCEFDENGDSGLVHYFGIVDESEV